MMPKLSVGKCRHSIWASVATTNWILFCLLGYMVHAWYSYIYMTNSIILLNTSDSIRVRCMIPTESDVFWTKPVGKKSSRTSKQCSVPCQKKVPSESDGIHWNPSDSHGNRWGRVKPSNFQPSSTHKFVMDLALHTFVFDRIALINIL